MERARTLRYATAGALTLGRPLQIAIWAAIFIAQHCRTVPGAVATGPFRPAAPSLPLRVLNKAAKRNPCQERKNFLLHSIGATCEPGDDDGGRSRGRSTA